MRIDIRIAGLPDYAAPRARLAAQLMAAFRYEAEFSAWDGSRCDVLIADIEDGYGKSCMEQALQSGICVLALSGTGTFGPDCVLKAMTVAPAAHWAELMASMLQARSAA
ncbi:MAG: hypothetical protein REI12_12720 [Pedobacter sp.]|nr:hypothetical protein [Pedobacter sp.]